MEKLKMQTPDLTDNNIEKIAALFPNVITETRAEDGSVKKAVDFDLLRQALSKTVVEGDDERYRLDWPGKKASLLKANTPITKTLRPCREESVNFDTTENLYIEGDNFEVLKILQESYLGKVKMIYIDPPYNTGNDFIYKDNFAKSKEEYEEDVGAIDGEGGKLFKNTDSNGRFHSDWLSMMYERLVVARDLLKDDGVVFISIDDNEVHNLRKICDEVFGEENFIAEFIWKSKLGKVGTTGTISTIHEYIVCYSKSSADLSFEMIKKDNDGRKENLRQWGQADRREDRPSMYYPITINKIEVFPIKDDGNDGRWRVGKEMAEELLKNGSLELVKKGEKYEIYRNFVAGVSEIPYDTLLLDEIGTTAKGSLALKSLDLTKYFDYSKPVDLTMFFANLCVQSGDIILDFFSGSATTAHSVMQLNREDGGNRKFIMVQLPEPCDEQSEAFKAGYKTIADIGKERIRRAGKKIIEDLKEKNQQQKIGEEQTDPSKLDIGFRVYKVDDSNMKDVFYHPTDLKQTQLSTLESNIKEDRTPEDLLTQVILDLGLELSLPIETKKILGNTVYFVQTNALAACFDKDIDFRIIDTIAEVKPLKVVFKDASFKDDKDRINVEERFKRLSPETKVTVL